MAKNKKRIKRNGKKAAKSKRSRVVVKAGNQVKVPAEGNNKGKWVFWGNLAMVAGKIVMWFIEQYN